MDSLLFREVVHLNLNSNRFDRLPASLLTLTNLEGLSLGSNDVDTLEVKIAHMQDYDFIHNFNLIKFALFLRFLILRLNNNNSRTADNSFEARGN